MQKIQASTFSLPAFSVSSKSNPISLQFDPDSQSLSLILTDSSILLFSYFSPFCPLSSPVRILSTTSSAFLSLYPRPNLRKTLFVTASPSRNSASTVLRAWILQSKSCLFAPVKLKFKSLIGSENAGVDIGVKHGFGVKVVGGVNVLVVHSIAESEIWVLGVKMCENGVVGLVKCAVILCAFPVYEINVSMGVLVIGEVGGVRIFPLRILVKGGGLQKKERAVDGVVDGLDKHGRLKTLKLKQDSGDLGSFFVAMTSTKSQDCNSNKGDQTASKVVSVHYFSQKKFLILDSAGDIYVLCLQNTESKATTRSTITSISGQIIHLDVAMKVRLLAIHRDMSSQMQFLWLSDGAHTVHVVPMSEFEKSVKETDIDENNEKEVAIPAIQVIFTSEKVQDIVPYSASGILILGQGNIFAYSII